MNVRELMAERAALIERAGALVDRAEADDRNLIAEENAQYEAFMADVRGLDGRITRQEDRERRAAQLGSTRGVDAGLAGRGDDQRRRDEIAAIAMYVRRGNDSGLMDLRASNDTDMNIGTPADGGYAVPTGHYRGIVAKRDAMSLVGPLGLLRIPGIGTTVNVPVDDGTANLFVSTAEVNTFDRDAPVLNQRAMTLVKYTKKVQLSDELLNDEDSNLIAFLDDYVGRAAGLTYNSLLFTEVLANGTSVALGDDTAVVVADPNTLIFNLKGEYADSAAFVMRRATEGSFRGLTGNPFLYQTTPSGTGRVLAGFPVYNSEALAAIGSGNKSIAFGNFGFVGYREALAMTFLRDPYSAANTGQVNLFYYLRVVFKVLVPEAVLYGKHLTA